MTPEQTERLEDALDRIEATLARLEDVLKQIALGLGIPPGG